MDMNAEPQMQLARVQAEEQQQAQRQAERDRWHDVLRNIKKDYTVLLNKFFVAEDEPVTAYAFSYVDERYEPRRGLPIYNLRQGQAFAEFASGMVALMMQQHDILHSTSLFDEFSWDEHLFVRLPSGGILSIGSLGLEFFDLSNILRVESLGNTFQPVLRVEEEADEDAYDAESLCLELKLLQETRRPSDDGNVFYDDYLAFVETLGSSFTRPLRYSILNSSSPTNGFTFHPSYLGNLFSLPAWGRFLEKLQDVTFFREVELSEDQWNVAARTAFQNVRFVDMRVPVSFPVAAQAQQITWNITGMPAMSPDPLLCLSLRTKNPLPKLVYNEPLAGWSNDYMRAFTSALAGVREFEVIELSGTRSIFVGDRATWESMWRGLARNVSLRRLTFIVPENVTPLIQHLEAIQHCLATNFTLDEIHLRDSAGGPIVLPEPQATFWNEQIQSQLTPTRFEDRITQELGSAANDSIRSFLAQTLLLRFQHDPTRRMSIVKSFFPSSTVSSCACEQQQQHS